MEIILTRKSGDGFPVQPRALGGRPMVDLLVHHWGLSFLTTHLSAGGGNGGSEGVPAASADTLKGHFPWPLALL